MYGEGKDMISRWSRVKIFVAYGYHERDQWIKDMVFPIIEAFGSDVVTGDQSYEGSIPDNVKALIERSDALIGFTTRRDPQNDTMSPTHQWVVSELTSAVTLKRRVVEVREQGVDPQGSLYQDLQRITYDEQARDKCLVEIVKAVGSWHQTGPVRLRLLPEELTKVLRPLKNDPGLLVQYTFRIGNYDSPLCDTKIIGIAGALFVEASNVPRDPLTMIRVDIKHGNKVWSSDFEGIDSYDVHLIKG